jgi:hypothetical protein
MPAEREEAGVPGAAASVRPRGADSSAATERFRRRTRGLCSRWRRVQQSTIGVPSSPGMRDSGDRAEGPLYLLTACGGSAPRTGDPSPNVPARNAPEIVVGEGRKQKVSTCQIRLVKSISRGRRRMFAATGWFAPAVHPGTEADAGRSGRVTVATVCPCARGSLIATCAAACDSD